MKLAPWLVESVTYPLHEWLQGRDTLREVRRLQSLADCAPRTVAIEQAVALRKLLAFAVARLPYYSTLFGRCRLDPHGDDPFTELARLPVLDKATVRTHAPDMTYRNVPGGLQPSSSGGTTGDTLHFFIDRKRQTQDRAARLFMQSRFGVSVGARRVHFWGAPLERRGSHLRHWRDAFLNERLLDAFSLAPAHLAAHLAALQRFRPAVLYGYPSALAVLAEYTAEQHAPVWPDLKLVVLTGEEATAEHLNRVRSVFGCAVAQEYGNREVGLIAHDCPARRMHLLAPHILVEVLSAGTLVPPGTVGELVCTPLNTRAQPLIRYRVGDAGQLDAEPCPCGLPFPTMQLTGGKITGFIALPGGRLCHGAVTSHVLRDEPGIMAFKTWQHTLTEFEILLVPGPSFDAATCDRVAHRYRQLFGPDVCAKVRIVDEIPPDPSGKRRYVVSAVAPTLGPGAFVTPDTLSPVTAAPQPARQECNSHAGVR